MKIEDGEEGVGMKKKNRGKELKEKKLYKKDKKEKSHK